MPYKDPIICSVDHCNKLRDDPRFKKCSACRAYMRQYKAMYRAQEAPEGVCSNYPDCRGTPRPGRRLCQRCFDHMSVSQANRGDKIAARNQAVQEEVIASYGGSCVCCGEARIDFMSIDHIDGYRDVGPRGSANLYRWLKRNAFPAGFRVLCMSCNTALGYLGYCGHGGLTQKRMRRGRELVGAQAYNQALKETVFGMYGGARCACCGEAHLECLSIDHVDGKGAEHRRTNPKARNICLWLRQNNYPPGFQVLCFNCNYAKSHGGCPHERERQASSTTPVSGTMTQEVGI